MSTNAQATKVDFAAIQAAAARIAPLAHRTPVMTSRSFDQGAKSECFFKCENLQRGGAFKIRGAANFLLALTPEQRKNGVVAFSSGNHAQAVAIAAGYCQTKATIVMPTDAPASKMNATVGYGADVVLFNRMTEDREAIGRRLAEETGGPLVPPFDHEWIIAGQGTTGLELLEQVPDLDALVVCLGGGGLLAGCATAANALRPGIPVFGVEPEAGNDFYLSMRSGERQQIEPPDTIADGLRTVKPGALTFPIVQSLVEDILLVTDDEIRETISFIASRMKLVVEPSGAVAAAAVLHGKLPRQFGRIGIILSGGNI